MTPDTNIDLDHLKAAAAGRWGEILTVICGIDVAILDGRHRPCPRCAGRDRFRAFGDFEETGGLFCNQCLNEKCSDGIAAVQWLCSCSFPEALKRIADHLGMDGQHHGNGQFDIVSEVAIRKHIPLESFKAFGAHEAERGKMAVCRVPMYGPDGKQCSHFDMATRDDRWLKGYSDKGKPAGLFLKSGKLPEAGQTVVIVEGPKDAAALDAEGFHVVGIPRKRHGRQVREMLSWLSCRGCSRSGPAGRARRAEDGRTAGRRCCVGPYRNPAR